MWGDTSRLLRKELGTRSGCCVICDEPLRQSARPKGGRNRSLLCGSPDCSRTYNTLWKSKQREMAAQAIELELEKALSLIEKVQRRQSAERRSHEAA